MLQYTSVVLRNLFASCCVPVGIKFRHQSYSLVCHVRHVRVPERSFARVIPGRSVVLYKALCLWLIRTIKYFPEAEENLLNDDNDPKKKTPTTSCQDPMFSMLQNVDKTRGTMANSILNMKQSLKRLHPSNTDDQLDLKRRKHSSEDEMSASDGSHEDGDDSDAELQPT